MDKQIYAIVTYLTKNLKYEELRAFQQFIYETPYGEWVDRLRATLQELSSRTSHDSPLPILAGYYRYYTTGYDVGEVDNKFVIYVKGAIAAANDIVPSLKPTTPNKVETYNFNASRSEIEAAHYFYSALNRLSPGNQWLMISNEEMKRIIGEGYMIECFGSCYNTRMKYFGSIAPIIDEPFGAVGTCWDIFETLIAKRDLKWRNEIIIGANSHVKILCSPPSGDYISQRLFENIKKLCSTRQTTVIFGVSARSKLLEEIRQNKYYRSEVELNVGYAFYNNKTGVFYKHKYETINMKGRSWINFTYSS